MLAGLLAFQELLFIVRLAGFKHGVDNDKQRIKDRISSRGLWGPIDSYSNSLIPKEVEWVVLYNNWFHEQAEKYKIKVQII